MAKRDDRLLRPNELSIELVPNRLSVLEGQRPGRLAQGLQAVVTETAGTPQHAGQARARPRRGINLSTIVTAAFFLLILGGRLLGDLGSRQATPRSTSDAQGGVEALAYAPSGTVVFGHGSNGRCGITDRATEFDAGEDVWWTATLPTPLDPSQKVRWRVLRLAVVQVERVGPGETPTGAWDRLCGAGPLSFDDPGNYAFEVRGRDDDRLFAIGRFTLR
jgi:hypothetical protein